MSSMDYSLLSNGVHDVSQSTTHGVIKGSSSSYPSDKEEEEVEQNYKNSDTLDCGILTVGVLNVFTDTLIGSSLVPILPETLHGNELCQSLVLSSCSISASIGTFFFGWLSDSYGWLITLSCFYPLIFLSCVLLLSANNQITLYLISRALAGIAISFMYPSNLRMVSTTHPQSLRATAVGLTLAGDLGSLCGPIGGAFLYAQGGSILTFGCLLVVCLLSTLTFLYVVFSSELVETERTRVNHYLDGFMKSISSKFSSRNSVTSQISFPLYVQESFLPKSPRDPPYHVLQSFLMKIYDEVKTMKRFWSFSFVSRALNLFFVWGTSVVLQVTLPYHWERNLGYRPETVGLLFLPHLLSRVLSCAISTCISDRTGIELTFLISFGSFLAWIAVILLFFYPCTQIIPIMVASAILGTGVGISDSCTFAWTSLYASQLSLNVTTTPESLLKKDKTSNQQAYSHNYEGRGFALMSVACDVGIVTLPILTSYLTTYNLSSAFFFLSFFGGFVFFLLIVCSLREKIVHPSSSPTSFLIPESSVG